jgi:hypothetical protein
VALRLKNRGVGRVRPLEGGLDRWKELGFPLHDHNECCRIDDLTSIQPSESEETKPVDKLAETVASETGDSEPEISEVENSEPEISEVEISEVENSEPESSEPEISEPEISEVENSEVEPEL